MLAVVCICWASDHAIASMRERKLRALSSKMAIAVQKHTELVEEMTKRLDEYENQYVLTRRFLRLAKRTPD